MRVSRVGLMMLIGLAVVLLAGGWSWADDEVVMASPLRTEAVQQHFHRIWQPRINAALSAADTLFVPDEPYMQDDVTDGVFSYLIGLLTQERYGVVSGRHMEAILETTGRKSRVPAELIASISRATADPHPGAWIKASFTKPLKVSVPYSILGYHPGSLISSQDVVAREWRLKRLGVPNPGNDGPATLEIEDLTVWAIVQGEIEIDIDGWLDRLMGGKLDDTQIVGLAVFRFQGECIGMALGYNRKGKPRSGALDMMEDRIRFPSSRELKTIARNLRARVVSRLAGMGLPVWLPS